MQAMFDFTGRTAVVSGGTSGIGRTIAKALAIAGANVVVGGRNTDAGKNVVEEIERMGRRAIYVSVDVSKKQEVERMVSTTVECFGSLDILVNSAGNRLRKTALETSEQEWEQTMNVNLKGTFFCCQAAAREMIKKHRGKIINISSIGAKVALDKAAAYCASKAGVSLLTQSLAVEWAPYNICVNAIAPGYTMTPINEDYLNKTEVLNWVMGRIPLQRVATPDDLTGLALYLSSDTSDYVTGQTFYVDGGLTVV